MSPPMSPRARPVSPACYAFEAVVQRSCAGTTDDVTGDASRGMGLGSKGGGEYASAMDLTGTEMTKEGGKDALGGHWELEMQQERSGHREDAISMPDGATSESAIRTAVEKRAVRSVPMGAAVTTGTRGRRAGSRMRGRGGGEGAAVGAE